MTVFKHNIKLMLEEKCMMKSIRMKLMAIALVVAVAVAAPITVPFTGNVAVAEAATVKISETKVTLLVGTSTTLKVTGTKSKVTWKTSNKAVASVTAKGAVKALSVGTAKITATVNKKNYTCTVTVVPEAQEVQIGGLGFLLPGIYEVSGDEVADGIYQAELIIPDSLSKITFIATVTGTEGVPYEEVEAQFADLNEEYLQESFDATYGAGKSAVSDLSAFMYESENGTISFAYSFILTTEKAAARMISYNLSIDGYNIEVISRDVEGYDIYEDAENLIDTLTYVE
jgi:hypothetical protein